MTEIGPKYLLIRSVTLRLWTRSFGTRRTAWLLSVAEPSMTSRVSWGCQKRSILGIMVWRLAAWGWTTCAEAKEHAVVIEKACATLKSKLPLVKGALVDFKNLTAQFITGWS